MTGNKEADLNLLLAHADDHGPVLAEGLPEDSAGDQPVERSELDGSSFYDLGAAGNDIGAQGWGIIAPEGKRGDELLARMRPLMDARADAMSGPLRVYRVPARMTTEQALRWRQDVYNNDEPDLIPRYQLFLGDLHEVPLELQHVQAPEGFVGRLAFNDMEGYDAYVDKVLQWERTPSPVERGDACFYSVHDGTNATRIGHRGLMEPILERARTMKQEGRFQAGEISQIGDLYEPSPDELMRAAASLEAGVLFTMSHGEGAPRQGWTSARAQLNGQGAMSFGAGGNLPGRDIAGKAFAPGGIWFMFACFGAGTPVRSKFHHWLSSLASAGQFRGRPDAVLASLPKGDQRPFIAALPQAALASADGPLAFIGHLDLAWTYGFMEITDGKQKGRPEKYYNILKSLFRGDRVGVALQELERFYNDKNQELTDLYDLAEEASLRGAPDPTQRAKLGHLWMVRQDLSGYILLGDPAVQLPLSRRAKPARPRSEAIEVRSAAPATPNEAAPPAVLESPPPPAPESSQSTPPASNLPITAAPPVAAESPPSIAAPPVAAESPPGITAPPVAAESPPIIAAPPVAAESPPSTAAAPVTAESPPVGAELAGPTAFGGDDSDLADEPHVPTRAPVPAATDDPPAPSVRSGEVAGEIDIDGRDGVKLRWRISWKLG